MTTIDALRNQAEALDAADPLAALRSRFRLRDGLIYLDGNSLGAMQHVVAERVAACLTQEWGDDLIASWNTADWVGLPQRAGAKIARLIGAGPDDVVVTDSTSVNLFKVLATALALRPERHVIVSERGNFPTDLYMAEGLSKLMGGERGLRLVDSDTEFDAAIDSDVAVVMLTHVDYRSGRMLDMAALTRQAHDAGALVIWDLAHSAGAVPVDLTGVGADFAIGCGYKYLNGGPGAPAFVYVAPRWQGVAEQPLSGWFGHSAPFAFEPGFTPAAGIARFLTGTPPVLSMQALDAALDIWSATDMRQVRAKSVQLTDMFIAAVEGHCAGLGLTLASPREAARRGSQVAFRHPDAYAVMQALIADELIGDFRAPDILRFGFTPLYTRHVDVVDAVIRLETVLREERYRDDAHQKRGRVT